MLTLEAITIRQGEFTLSGALQLDAGRFLAVLGPSGAGKSTLISAIAGFTRIAGGKITWGESRIDALSPARRPTAILFQDNNLFPHLTALQNVALAVTKLGRLGTDEAARAQDALSMVGLAAMGDRMPGSLSGGQQSRVALARILLQDKPVILMDEPFSALGPGQRAEMMALCRDMLGRLGRTVIFVTHDPGDAARADDICVVAGGRFGPAADARSVLADPPQVLRDYLGK